MPAGSEATAAGDSLALLGGERVASTLVEIMADVPVLLNAERATLFLYAPETDELWSLATVGGRQTPIRIKADVGIAGHVMRTGEPTLVRDPYADPRFNPEVDRRSGFVTRAILCRPVETGSGERIGVMQVLNPLAGAFTERDDHLLQVVANQAATSIENARLFEQVKSLRDKEQELLRRLEGQHRQLQDAFVVEERNSQQLALRLRGRKLRRIIALVCLALLLIGSGYLALNRLNLIDVAALPLPLGTPAPEQAAAAQVDFVAVTARPVQDWALLRGQIEPMAWISVTSPIDAVLLELDVRYGQLVEKGTVLARLDTSQLEQKLRDADSALIQAEEEAERLQGWAESVEVARSRREVATAEAALVQARRQLDETQRLFDAGIVARTELDSTRQAVQAQQNGVLAAREALAATLDQGSAEKQRVAELKLANARVQYDEARSAVERAVVRSPATGIIFPASEAQGQTNSGTRRETISVGSAVARSTPLFLIADMTGVALNALVEEADLLALRLGQPAKVSVDAVPGLVLDAGITTIGSRAANEQGQGQGGGQQQGPARFEVGLVVRDLTDEARSVLRIGMTATARVLTYDNPAALVVPFEAIEIAGDQRVVRVRTPDGGLEPRQVQVRTTLLDGVEIAGGLEPGMQLAVERLPP